MTWKVEISKALKSDPKFVESLQDVETPEKLCIVLESQNIVLSDEDLDSIRENFSGFLDFQKKLANVDFEKHDFSEELTDEDLELVVGGMVLADVLGPLVAMFDHWLSTIL